MGGRGCLPVDEGTLHLYLVEEAGDAWEDMPPPEEAFAILHQVCHGVCAITYALLYLAGNERDGLCLVQAQAPGKPLLGEEPGLWERNQDGKTGA